MLVSAYIVCSIHLTHHKINNTFFNTAFYYLLSHTHKNKKKQKYNKSIRKIIFFKKINVVNRVVKFPKYGTVSAITDRCIEAVNNIC